jgi:(1->4)-alpha-D-glucan 1-alpha-D-glucosylmutase
LLLKLTSPGVPDIYQGQEIWDFSLVDPDNRRPVDFELRRWLLDEIKEKLAAGDDARLEFARHLGCHPSDNRLKLYVTREALAYRREHAELFHRGRYVPLAVEGDRQEHVCAFAWRMPEAGDSTAAIVVAPRLLARLTPIAEGANHPPPPFGNHLWEGTSVNLEPLPPGRAWRNIFTGETISPEDQRLSLADVLSDFPVALLDAQSHD